MKAVWQGYIGLGQLGIPVRLYSATQSIAPQFKLLHTDDGSPVERILRCREEGKEISHGETVKAIPTDSGAYVALTKQELDRSIRRPLKIIEISQFTDHDAVAPLYYEKPYYIVPGKGGERAYALMREVLLETKTLAVAQFVLRGAEHLAALSVHHSILMLYQLRYAAEILPASLLKTRSLPKASPNERAALREVVEKYRGPFFIEDYRDEYTDAINELISRKLDGLPPPRRERIEPHATNEDEIVPALQATLQESPTLDNPEY